MQNRQPRASLVNHFPEDIFLSMDSLLMLTEHTSERGKIASEKGGESLFTPFEAARDECDSIPVMGHLVDAVVSRGLQRDTMAVARPRPPCPVKGFACGFRRLRPGIPIERGHAFRSKAATCSDEG